MHLKKKKITRTKYLLPHFKVSNTNSEKKKKKKFLSHTLAQENK